MTTCFKTEGRTAPTPYEGAASAAGLRAHRTDISFQNVTPDIVRVDVRVSNDGSLHSPPMEVAVQSAPLGAFLSWHPLLTLTVPPLPPRTSAVVRGPPSIFCRTSARCCSDQASPSSAMPVDSISLAIRRNCCSATRALALPHTAGRSSRGKAKTVRRMASCLTIYRSA